MKRGHTEHIKDAAFPLENRGISTILVLGGDPLGTVLWELQLKLQAPSFNVGQVELQVALKRPKVRIADNGSRAWVKKVFFIDDRKKLLHGETAFSISEMA